MSFIKRKKHPAGFLPHAWRDQKMPTPVQSVAVSAPAPVEVSASAPAKRAPRKASAKRASSVRGRH